MKTRTTTTSDDDSRAARAAGGRIMPAIYEVDDHEARELPDDVGDQPHRPGSWPASAGATFANLETFYAAAPDAARRHSPEWDYGVVWRDTDAQTPRYRVSWIVNTGELIAVRLDGDESVEVLGVTFSADDVLVGWEDVCETPASMSWARDRISRVATVGGGRR